MAVKKYRGTTYHLWNPFTVLEDFLPFLGFGPSVITRGEGPYVFNDRGKRFINGFSSLWNVAIGYGREELVEAAAKQMRELAYASCVRQVHPRAIELAAKLVEITGYRYGKVYLGTNGSEAIETALHAPLHLVIPYGGSRFTKAINRGIPLMNISPMPGQN